MSQRLLDRVRAAPYATLSVSVLAVAAYLCLVNLDYAALWHDEAPTTLIARNLLERGDITGWDGRNLVGGTNGRTLNADLRDVLPPLMYVLNAAGLALFGVNETGARIVPALYLLLCQRLAGYPRLVFFCLLFAAWSPQLLLYFRQARYFSFMAFALIAAFWCYERWWRSASLRDLAALTLVAALAFFNHYAGGAATMLALAVWHLLFRARATTPRQWLGLAVGGAVVVALGTAYLGWLGVIGGERSGFLAYTGVGVVEEYRGTIPPVLLRIALYTRDLFAADWISWPVFLWFAGMLTLVAVRARRGGRARPAARDDALPLAAAGDIVLVGALFALFSAALSVQAVWILDHPYSDLRYYMGALPLLLAMKGLFVEWAWRRHRIAGAAALAVLLCSSAGAWPFNIPMAFTGERTLGLHLFQFVREIHRPYRDSLRVASKYLLEHAGQNDLVYTPGFADREALTFAAGHHVLFCCALDDESPLPPAARAAMGPRLTIAETMPDWVVLFGTFTDEYWQRVEGRFAVAAGLDVYYYPTQRPAINLHAFTPLPAGERDVYVLRRRPEDKLYRAAEALQQQKRHEEALAGFRAVLAIDSEHAPAHAGAGAALLNLGRYREALDMLATAVSLAEPAGPPTGGMHRLMGHAARQLERPAEAARHYARALEIDPDDAQSIDHLALVRFGQHRFEDALALYRRMLALDPDSALTHANLGATLYHLGRAEEAIASFEHALTLDPSLEAAHTGLQSARAVVQQGAP